jgi:hypothetical protein
VAAATLRGLSFQFPPISGRRPALLYIHNWLSSITSFDIHCEDNGIFIIAIRKINLVIDNVDDDDELLTRPLLVGTNAETHTKLRSKLKNRFRNILDIKKRKIQRGYRIYMSFIMCKVH